MTSRSLLNLVLLAAVVSLALWVYFKPKPQGDTQEYRVSSLSAENAQSIRVEWQGLNIMLQKVGERWHLTQPLQGRADEIKVGRILEILAATSPRRFPAAELERFDLAQPAVRLRIDHESFGFGGLAPITSEQYVASGENVYLLAPRYAAALPRQPADLLSPKLLAENEIPVALELENLKVIQQDGNWRITPQKPGLTLTQNELNHWVQSWQQAYAASITPGANEPETTGKQAIKISLRDGNAVQLLILQQQPELILLRVDAGMRYRFPAESGKRLLDPYTAAGG
ncbi:MAG: DUF4340 domain-containing protein [Nitrosomonadaceae bacterium]|nr:MAG: DUF4340 domain-containing protein [Nitrosomonadaceae bacterium]